MSTGLPVAAIESIEARQPPPLPGVRATGIAGLVSAAIIAAATFAAIFGPLLAPYDPNLPNLSLAWVGPVGGHLLGFDVQGRDVLSRLLVGAQTSMLGPLVVVIVSMITGSVLPVMARADGAPVLEAAGLRKEFGDLVAVDDVSFRLPAGRSLAIVGESGSGKPRSCG